MFMTFFLSDLLQIIFFKYILYNFFLPNFSSIINIGHALKFIIEMKLKTEQFPISKIRDFKFIRIVCK